MVYIVILLFGLGAFVIVFLYQQIFITKMHLFERVLFLFILTGILVTSAYIRLQYVEKGTLEANILDQIASPIDKSVETIHYVIKVRGLETAVQNVIKEEKGIYGVGIKNFKTGDEYYFNENTEFETASLYKLWVMATVFQKIEQEKLSLNQQLSANVKDLNDMLNIDEEDAELKEGVISNTVEGALNRMITVSDNYSAFLLVSNVRFSTVMQFLIANGFTSSTIGSSALTNVTDMISFFEKLYNKQLVSPDASNQMLELLKQQTLNDRIPKYLPEGTVIAHKTGELDGVKHDAGIVFSQKGDYIIVLLSETSDLNHAAEVEAQISKKVWDYFNK